MEGHGGRGGILGLVRLDKETDGALTADMMERLGVTFAKAPITFGWHAMATWARHLPQDSATWRATHPEHARWSSDLGRAAMLADLFDAIAHVIGAIGAAHGARPRPPKPYPRPGARQEQRIGSGGIPVAEFDAWYYQDEEEA